MTTEYKWSTTPPQVTHELDSHEYWFCRKWLKLSNHEHATPIVDMYRLLYTLEGKTNTMDDYVAYLTGPSETIKVGEIAEDSAVEWQPVRGPEGPTVATESITIEFDDSVDNDL